MWTQSRVKSGDWKQNDRWAWFIGDGRERLRLTTKPEPYTLERTLSWIARQVAPTLKMAKRIDALNGANIIDNLVQGAKLTEKHEQIIKQQTASPEEVIAGKRRVLKDVGID